MSGYFKRNVPSVRLRRIAYALIITNSLTRPPLVLGVTGSVKGAFITVVFLLSTCLLKRSKLTDDK